ncbi:uncharacterized protein LOC110617849 [Manihot esculenta]|uniref:Uncharacterized protein n=2 Tax=Manihot esculenta TaxID=3983 RepID=A0ACB7HIB6_MANES|nr:uncharacterized protein LOC110617849 [Manihot esculenta]KAG8652005.1 hypothetical protein MANES_06G043901v8 [Manihot esculenta]
MSKDHLTAKLYLINLAHDHLVFLHRMAQTRPAMDWFSWLSRSGLEPSLVYQYSLAFARNQLQQEDLAHFNHEFLQSMGISIAKHRLEILKLARKEAGPGGTTALSKFIFAVNETKKNLKKCICRFVFHEDPVLKVLPEPPPRRGALTRKYKSDNDVRIDKPPVVRTRRQAKSGPLDGRVPGSFMVHHRNINLSGPLDGRVPENLMPIMPKSLKLSGPLDGKVNDRLAFAYRSKQKQTGTARLSDDSKQGRVRNDDFDEQSLWAQLFQDMKPT